MLRQNTRVPSDRVQGVPATCVSPDVFPHKLAVSLCAERRAMVRPRVLGADRHVIVTYVDRRLRCRKGGP